MYACIHKLQMQAVNSYCVYLSYLSPNIMFYPYSTKTIWYIHTFKHINAEQIGIWLTGKRKGALELYDPVYTVSYLSEIVAFLLHFGRYVYTTTGHFLWHKSFSRSRSGCFWKCLVCMGNHACTLQMPQSRKFFCACASRRIHPDNLT